MSQPLGEERRVVPFAAPLGRVRRESADESGARGAILLFTGVRYERLAPEPVEPKPRRRKPARPRRGA
jgi:hypothetical protein